MGDRIESSKSARRSCKHNCSGSLMRRLNLPSPSSHGLGQKLPREGDREQLDVKLVPLIWLLKAVLKYLRDA